MATTTRTKKRAPVTGEVDKIIGQRMRSFRLTKYMSQEKLGKHLGVTFQQIQKYENGTNRLSGSRLITAAKVLGTSVEQIVGSNGPELQEQRFWRISHGVVGAAGHRFGAHARTFAEKQAPRGSAGDDRSHHRDFGALMASLQMTKPSSKTVGGALWLLANHLHY